MDSAMAANKLSSEGLRWFFNFSAWQPTKSQIMRAFSAIQEEERVRIHQFKYQADAKASLVGRLMLRKAAKCLIQASNQNGIVSFGRSGRGRPFLENADGIELNVSHAGSLTVLAAAKSKPGTNLKLGVDVMLLTDSRIERLDEFFRLMRRQFTDAEWQTIRANTSDETKLASFFRHWSLKESYVKAVGTGLNLDLRTIDFHINSALSAETVTIDTELSVDGDQENNWSFEEAFLQEHVVSVASSPPISSRPIKWVEKNICDILPEDEDLSRKPDPKDWDLFSQMTKIKPF